MQLKKDYVKLKVIFDRGKMYIGYLQLMMVAFLTLRSLSEFPKLAFVGSFWWLVGGMIVSLIFIGLLGFLDLFVFRTFHGEQELYSTLDPFKTTVLDILKDLQKEKSK